MKEIYGHIKLYHYKEIIAEAYFKSILERKEIIKQWTYAFGKNSHTYYVIYHTEINNISKSELSLIKKLNLEPENHA